MNQVDHNKILADAAARHLHATGAKNYTGAVFALTFDADDAQIEVLVTTQKVGAPTPHDLRVKAEAQRDALQQRLTAADERWDELVSAVRSINYGPAHKITVQGDDEPQYRQRKEWIDWVLGLCDTAPASGERSNKDYAIEHAEYMAISADHVLDEFQAYGLALLAVDEGGDDHEGELFEAVDSARQDLQEALVELRSRVYEFRKRRARIDSVSPDAEA